MELKEIRHASFCLGFSSFHVLKSVFLLFLSLKYFRVSLRVNI